MNISFIALNISGAETVQFAADKLRGVLSSFGRCDFRLCSSMSQVSSSLSNAFANSDLIVVGIEPAAYCKSKLAILHAMHIKTQLDDNLKNLISQGSEMNTYQLSMHCAMPVNAEVFASHDGLYSGFAIQSGKQQFVLVNLDKLTFESVVSNGLVPYLKKNLTEDTQEEEILPDASYARRAGEALRDCGKKVYFASTPSCEMVRSLCEEEIEAGVFVFSDYTAKRGSEAPRSYIADLARYVIPEGENALGAAVSNVFTGTSQETGEQKYNVYVAVADKTASRVLRFVSQSGETPQELITASIEVLMEMICDKCSEVQEEKETFSAEPIEEIEELMPGDKKKKKGSAIRTVVYVLLAVLLAVAVYFGYTGFVQAEENSENASRAFSQAVYGVVDNADISTD